MTLDRKIAWDLLDAQEGTGPVPLLEGDEPARLLGGTKRIAMVGASPDPAHGRIINATLTPAGGARLAAAKRRINALERRLTARLSAADERTLRTWLAAVARDFLPR